MSEELPDNTSEQFKNLFEGDTWTLPTDMEVIRPARDEFGRRLEEAGWADHEDFSTMDTAFSDVLANAIAHGNLGVKLNPGERLGEVARKAQQEHPSDKTVTVVLRISPTDVAVTVTDQGDGFKWRELTDPTTKEHVVDNKGRGILMARLNYDSVTFNNKGNEVTLMKHRQPSA